jgi:hypothetical protein
MTTLEQKKSLDLILPELRRRFLAPCKSVTFYTQLIVGVFILGGFGVYFRSHWTAKEMSAALLGYFTPLVGAALLEFNFEKELYLRSFGIFASFFFFVLALFVAGIEQPYQLILAIAGAILGVLFWWVAHGLDDRFNDVIARNAVGGDSGNKLSESTDKSWAK